MKKSLLALAVLGAFAGVAQAQTSVTIYGSFDAGVREQTKQSSTGNSRVTMGSTGTYNSNRLGFKGVEDLGGGLNAHFTLEQGFNSGTGQLDTATTTNKLFNRSAFVGIGGQWGSLDLGRQYTVAFKTVGAYDPFNYKFTGIIPTSQGSISAGTRFDNDIQYTGTFGPLTARAEYSLGEQIGGGNNGGAAAVGATFATGPFSVGAAYTKRKPSVSGLIPAGGTATVADRIASTNRVGTLVASTLAGANQTFQDNTDWTVGGAFTFGPARIAAGYSREKQDLASGTGTINVGTAANPIGASIAVGGQSQQKNAWIGGSYDITPALGLTAAYYDTKYDNFRGAGDNGKRQLFIIGATYALSKRTNFYADVDYARFKGAAIGAQDAYPFAGVSGQTPGVQGGSGQLGAGSTGQSGQAGVSVGINHLF